MPGIALKLMPGVFPVPGPVMTSVAELLLDEKVRVRGLWARVPCAKCGPELPVAPFVLAVLVLAPILFSVGCLCRRSLAIDLTCAALKIYTKNHETEGTNFKHTQQQVKKN